MKNDLSSSPPPPYSLVIARSNDTKNSLVSERRPSYDEAVANGTSYGLSNESNRPMNQYSKVQQLQKPQTNVQLIQRKPYINDNQYNNDKQYQQPVTTWESINDESATNGKIINYSNTTSSRGNDSKFKQGKFSPIFKYSKTKEECSVLVMCACVCAMWLKKSLNYISSPKCSVFHCYFPSFASDLTGKHFLSSSGSGLFTT